MHALRRISVLCAVALAATASRASAQAPAAPDSVVSIAIQEGSTAAQAIGTGLWTVGGFAGGAVLGPVGAGLAYALASSSASPLPTSTVTRIGKKEAEYQLGFQQAYTDKLTSKRRSSALVGGLAGSTLFVAAITGLLAGWY